MRKNLPAAPAFLLPLLLLTQCHKQDDSVFQVRFYTTHAQDPRTLYIDNADKGTLPYFAQAPQCGQAYSDGLQPLVVTLRSGHYTIVGKDAQGHTTTYGTMGISGKRMSVSGGTGGLHLESSGDCVSLGLLE